LDRAVELRRDPNAEDFSKATLHNPMAASQSGHGEETRSRTQSERLPSRCKREISAIFLAHLIAANLQIRYVGIAVGDSPCANQ
jgi:hypothetical protein